jgi:hypothetical protein
LLRYEREKELIKKRDETKAELKALLKKYIKHHGAIDDRGNINQCAEVVGLAQREMDGMHHIHDIIVRDINHSNKECKNYF